jgi:hypothetical protein
LFFEQTTFTFESQFDSSIILNQTPGKNGNSKNEIDNDHGVGVGNCFGLPINCGYAMVGVLAVVILIMVLK